MILDCQIKISSFNENKIAYYLIKSINWQSDFFFLQKGIQIWISEKNKTLFKNQIANSFSKNCVFRFK